jgi:hypothetical protein
VLVKEALYAMGVPVAYMQLDDWWYQGKFFFGNVKAVTDWVRKTPAWRAMFTAKTVSLPRQARDEHRNKAFSAARVQLLGPVPTRPACLLGQARPAPAALHTVLVGRLLDQATLG